MNAVTNLTVEMKVVATDTADLAEIGPSATMLLRILDELSTGTGLDAADQVYADENTIIADATNQIDLVGTHKDIYGDTVNFTRIKGILFHNTSTTASILQLGGGTDEAGTNAFDTWITSTAADGSEGVYVRPNGIFMIWAPDATAYACSAGSDILGINEESTLAGAYSIIVVGESA